jgi:hypothetical protein
MGRKVSATSTCMSPRYRLHRDDQRVACRVVKDKATERQQLRDKPNCPSRTKIEAMLLKHPHAVVPSSLPTTSERMVLSQRLLCRSFAELRSQEKSHSLIHLNREYIRTMGTPITIPISHKRTKRFMIAALLPVQCGAPRAARAPTGRRS